MFHSVCLGCRLCWSILWFFSHLSMELMQKVIEVCSSCVVSIFDGLELRLGVVDNHYAKDDLDKENDGDGKGILV